MNDVNEYMSLIGLKTNEAEGIAKINYDFKTIRSYSENAAITADYNPRRLNLAHDNYGYVVDAWVG